MSSQIEPSAVRLFTADAPDVGHPIELGGMVSVAVVEASNIVRDVIEYIRNIFGGRMSRYEGLLDRVLARAEDRFKEALAEKGYDGAVAVRFAHPNVVSGGAELIVYGTGYRRA